MSLPEIRILIVDDDPEDVELVEDLLAQVDLWEPIVTKAPSYEEGLTALREEELDVCLLDYRLGARTGIDFLSEPAATGSRVPVVLLTGQGGMEVDRKAWEAGAADYLSKDSLSVESLERAVRYAAERRRRRRA